MALALTDSRNTRQMLADQADRFGDKTFLIYKDRVISYRQMFEQACRCGRGFWEYGIRSGDKVGLFFKNRPEYLEAAYGLMSIGAVQVPINTAYKGDLLAYVLDHSDSRAVVIEPEFAPLLADLKSMLPKLQQVWVVGETAGLPELPWPVQPLQAFYALDPQLPDVQVSPYDVAGIIYTSGTTGPSKGAMCSHHYFYAFAAGWGNAVDLSVDDVYYNCMPFFHFNGQIATVWSSWLRGATVVLEERFSASQIWDTIRRHGVTGFNCLGSMLHMLHKQPPHPDDRNHKVRFIWAAPAPVEIFHDLERRFGVSLLSGYGMTETNMPLYMVAGDVRPGSCGKPWGALDVEIIDDNDWPVPVGTPGQIATRPKHPWVMMTGYYKMPEKTSEAFRNLWFHTGDRGYRDADGFYYFVDRSKDAIRRRGENISSYEIEKVVDQHPAVLESAAIAVPSELAEDEVKVLVVLQPGQDLSPAELLTYCMGRMAYFMVPRYVEFVLELPKTPNGKVQKQKLRDAGITPATWDRDRAGFKVTRQA